MMLTKYPAILLASSITLIHAANDRYLETSSFSSPCENFPDATQLTTTNFHLSLTPPNRTLFLNFSGSTTYTGNTTITILLTAEALQVYNLTIDPCQLDAPSPCPTSPGEIVLNANWELALSDIFQIPDSTFSASGIEGRAYVLFNSTVTGMPWGCVQGAWRNGANESVAQGNGSTTGGQDGSGGNGTGEEGGGNGMNGEEESGASNVLVGSKMVGLVTALSLVTGFSFL